MIDSNIVMWSTIVGWIMPLLIAIIEQPGWTDQRRAAVMFLACLVASIGSVYFQGQLSVETKEAVITTILLVMVTAIASYKGFWKPSGVAGSIERATSPSS